MKLPENINETEPWGADDRLAPGIYLARVAEAEEKSSSNGNPMIVLTWRVDEGDWKGAEIRDWVTVTEATAGRVVALLRALAYAIPTDGMLKPAALVNRRATIVVRNEPYTDRNGDPREGPKVKGYRPVEEGPGGSDVSSAFDTRATVGASAGNDDDVPF